VRKSNVDFTRGVAEAGLVPCSVLKKKNIDVKRVRTVDGLGKEKKKKKKKKKKQRNCQNTKNNLLLLSVLRQVLGNSRMDRLATASYRPTCFTGESRGRGHNSKKTCPNRSPRKNAKASWIC